MTDVPIGIPDAILGGKVEVPTESGKCVNVTIPLAALRAARRRIPGMGIAGGDECGQFDPGEIDRLDNWGECRSKIRQLSGLAAIQNG